MANVITTHPSKKSKLRRLSFLPRIAVTVDFAGKQFSYFQVPLLETLFNMKDSFTLAKLIEVTHQQIREIDLPKSVVPKVEKTKKK